jgi:rifampicin phosphotransferase
VVTAVGGKAASLARLATIPGVRVPAWVTISAEAHAAAIAAAGIGDAIDAVVARLAAGPAGAADCEAAAAELAPLLARLAPPADLAAAVATLGAGPFAVRSSGIDEDGAVSSFAGQHDTFLFVEPAALGAAVVRCWQSGLSPRALSYRAQRGLLDRPAAIAVVIQQMVEGRVSGVLFSADPSSGDRTKMVLTATWGLGEGVVSGRMACDTFVVARADQPAIVARDVADKLQAVRRAAGGTAEVDVPAPDRARASLADDEIVAVARLGEAIEAVYGHPVDVEWTIDDSGPWLLQARPITGLPPVDRHAGRRRLWDNSNIIESYSGVTTPMTYSFARRAYGMVYRQAFALLGVPRRDLEAHAATFEQMIGLVGGRVYYNLESWYRALQLLPGYKLNAEFMEQMMGVREGASFGRDVAPRAAWRRWLVDLPELAASLGVLGVRFARAQRLVERFFAEFADHHADFWERELEQLSFDQLVDVYLDAEQRIMGRWQAPIVNDILAMIYFGALRKALGSWGLADAALHNDLLCGEGGLESTEPTRDLLALCDEVRGDPALVALLRGRPAGEARAAVAADPRWGWLTTRLALHVDRFGDRCIDELKLEQTTLRDDDTFLYAALKGYLAAPPVTVADMETRERAIRAAAEARVLGVLGRDPVKRRLFRLLLEGARRHVKNRENLRFARTRAFGLVRRILVAAGRRLAEAGRLDEPADVFYLEIGELVGFARGTATTTDLRGLAAVRKAEYARHRAAAPPPERFWTRGAAQLDPVIASLVARPAEAIEAAGAGTVLQGVAAAPGRVRAAARLVHDPRGAELAGDVLVAHRTDPGWVPLFPSARAVVVERGSVLSHSAIVAREFGIPCVVGLRDALARIPDGALVEVDGGAGTVTIL